METLQPLGRAISEGSSPLLRGRLMMPLVNMRRPSSVFASSPLGAGRGPTTDSLRQTSLSCRRGTLSYAPSPHIAAPLAGTAVRSPIITPDHFEEEALKEEREPVDAGAAPAEKEAKGEDEDDEDDTLPSAAQLMAGGENLKTTGNQDDDSDENEYHPAIPGFDKDLQDRSQDDIADCSSARRDRINRTTFQARPQRNAEIPL